MLKEHLTPEWSPSEEYPGYYFKVLHFGNVTATVYRPILTPEEQARREAIVIQASTNFLEAIERRKAGASA